MSNKSWTAFEQSTNQKLGPHNKPWYFPNPLTLSLIVYVLGPWREISAELDFKKSSKKRHQIKEKNLNLTQNLPIVKKKVRVL